MLLKHKQDIIRESKVWKVSCPTQAGGPRWHLSSCGWAPPLHTAVNLVTWLWPLSPPHLHLPPRNQRVLLKPKSGQCLLGSAGWPCLSTYHLQGHLFQGASWPLSMKRHLSTVLSRSTHPTEPHSECSGLFTRARHTVGTQLMCANRLNVFQWLLHSRQSWLREARFYCISTNIQFSSVHFSRSVVSDSLRPHESQHARPPCPSPSPGVHSDSRPSSQ